MSLKVIVGAAVLVLAFAIVVGDPEFKRYRIPSQSMEPTVHQGATINLNGGAHPRIGDVVIFKAPENVDELDAQCPSRTRGDQACAGMADGPTSITLIKRIVAGPGDEVAFKDGRVILNGKPQKEPYITDCGGGNVCDLPAPITVKDGSYYMVGDNRGASDDSRFWGSVPEEWILGRAERCSAIYFFCSPV